MTGRRFASIGAAAVATVTLSACGSGAGVPTSFGPHQRPVPVPGSQAGNSPSVYTPVSTPAALAYVQAHPVPARPGMTAGVVLNVNVTGAGVITVTIVTARDGVRQATCGTATKGCDITDAGKVANLPGTYVYLGGPGVITSSSDIQIIRIDAVPGGWS